MIIVSCYVVQMEKVFKVTLYIYKLINNMFEIFLQFLLHTHLSLVYNVAC